MMSALLVALAATAVFAGIDGATATSAQSKSRAVATTLAHEDQERLRAMDPRKLASYNPAPAKKVVNRVEYTITSTAAWVSDRGESESCTKGDGRVTYVRISSKVEWPDMRGSKPVNASSLVAINNAYSKGSLAVKIVDRTGATGVPGVPVAVDSPVGQTKQTNDAGCVVFDGLSSGAYFGEFSKLGYVDPNGANVVRPPNGWNVTTGSTAISTYQYDLAGQINFAFDTKYLSGGPWDIASPPGNEVTVLHQNIPGPPLQGMRVDQVADNTPAHSFVGLFPFTTPYSSFAGNCTTSAPGWSTPSSATVPPAGTATPNPVKLRMPALGVRVMRNGATPTSTFAGDVIIKPVAAGCLASKTFTAYSANSFTPAPDSATARDFALPPGDYTVCADTRVGLSSTADRRTLTISNNDENGQLVTVDIQTSSSSNGNSDGHCAP